MRLIADGVVDRESVEGLARRLGYSSRHLNRLLLAEVGAGPLALARSQRAHTARLLIETTELPVADIAFAAGFSSIRQFNDTVRTVFGVAPTALRSRSTRPARDAGASTAGEINLRLPYRAPFPCQPLLAFLGQRAVPGVEAWDGQEYRRTMSLPHDVAAMALSPGDGHVRCRLWLGDLRDLGSAVQRARRLLDLDADPVAIIEQLGPDPILGPAIAAVPGRRVPGCVDGAELAMRAVLGQQVSVAGAATLAGRIAAQNGASLSGRGGPGYGAPPAASAGGRHETALHQPALGRHETARHETALHQPALGRHETALDQPDGAGIPAGEPADQPTRLFPTAAAIATADPAHLPMPQSRARALVGLAEALASGEIVIDGGAERDKVERQLLARPGIGRWTASYVALRALSDPDAFVPTDLGVRRALERAGLPGDPAHAAAVAERWRPWRAYALQYLWASSESPNRSRSAS